MIFVLLVSRLLIRRSTRILNCRQMTLRYVRVHEQGSSQKKITEGGATEVFWNPVIHTDPDRSRISLHQRIVVGFLTTSKVFCLRKGAPLSPFG